MIYYINDESNTGESNTSTSGALSIQLTTNTITTIYQIYANI